MIRIKEIRLVMNDVHREKNVVLVFYIGATAVEVCRYE